MTRNTNIPTIQTDHPWLLRDIFTYLINNIFTNSTWIYILVQISFFYLIDDSKNIIDLFKYLSSSHMCLKYMSRRVFTGEQL